MKSEGRRSYSSIYESIRKGTTRSKYELLKTFQMVKWKHKHFQILKLKTKDKQQEQPLHLHKPSGRMNSEIKEKIGLPKDTV